MRELLLALAVSIVAVNAPRDGFARAAVEVADAGAPIARIWPRAGAVAVDGAVEAKTRFSKIRRGEILGLVVFLVDWRDYRGQTVPAGVYELVYAVQPLLKDHAGTSAFRDFAILKCDKPAGHPFVMALVEADQGDAALRVSGIDIGLELDETGNLGF